MIPAGSDRFTGGPVSPAGNARYDRGRCETTKVLSMRRPLLYASNAPVSSTRQTSEDGRGRGRPEATVDRAGRGVPTRPFARNNEIDTRIAAIAVSNTSTRMERDQKHRRRSPRMSASGATAWRNLRG